jgi:hypothetical protein
VARIHIPNRDNAPAASKPLLDAVFDRLGFVPNLHRIMALSPSALGGVSDHCGGTGHVGGTAFDGGGKRGADEVAFVTRQRDLVISRFQNCSPSGEIAT